jgi:hypothetical protein
MYLHVGMVKIRSLMELLWHVPMVGFMWMGLSGHRGVGIAQKVLGSFIVICANLIVRMAHI